jgi:hypothetical protein
VGNSGVLSVFILKKFARQIAGSWYRIYKIKGGEEWFSDTEPKIILTKIYEQTMNE